MSMELLVYTVASVLGIGTGLAARSLPASGKVALLLGLVLPPAGVALSMAFC